jgi:hypothetical protein
LQASEAGMRVRTTNFEEAKQHFLQAAKIIYILLQNKTPGASLVDLEWQLSSYCAAAAGTAFFKHKFATAIIYYLAFFSIAVETEPVWEKVDRLVPSMLSFYFTMAANQEMITLDFSPGHRHPAAVITAILNYPNPKVQEHGMDLVRKLAEINPALLRKIIQRLDAISMRGNGEQSAEARAQEMLLGILDSPVS